MVSALLTEPAFYFGDTQYSVDESASYVELQVWRTGTDLSKPSSVTVRSRKTEPPSADGEQPPTSNQPSVLFFSFQLLTASLNETFVMALVPPGIISTEYVNLDFTNGRKGTSES